PRPLPGDEVQVVEADAVEVAPAVEYRGVALRELRKRHIARACLFSGAGAGGLQQVRLAGTRGPVQPGDAEMVARRERSDVPQGLRTGSGDEAREARTVAQAHAQWQLAR